MSHLVTALPCLAGFALLLFALPRHQQDWLGRKLAMRTGRWLRGLGFVLLVIGLILAGWGMGWAYGAVAWCGWLSVSAALTLAAQTNCARILALLRR